MGTPMRVFSIWFEPYKLARLFWRFSCAKQNCDGDFVLVRPHDLGLVHVWMERAQGDVMKDEENAFFKMLRVQWWVPMKKGINLDE